MKNLKISPKFILSASLFAALFAAVYGCGTQKKKIEQLEAQKVAAQLALSRNEIEEERKIIEAPRRDTLTVQDDQGNEVLIMKAVKDDESGEMVAHEVLNAAVITARFRNVAERHGKIDLRFEVIVPPEMQDTKWQLRFYPDMFILQDSIRLEPVIITGEEYRANQLRGYDAIFSCSSRETCRTSISSITTAPTSPTRFSNLTMVSRSRRLLTTIRINSPRDATSAVRA